MTDPPRRRPPDPRTLEGLADAFARERNVTKRRVQEWISYMVLASRLEQISREPGGPRFTIKGGVALELRLGGNARATRDIDLIVEVAGEEDLVAALRTGLDEPYEDFRFRVKGDEYRMEVGSVRVSVAVEYRGRAWNTIRIDLSPVEDHRLEVDLVEPLDLSRFRIALVDGLSCLSLRYHMAHKLHGVTRPTTEEFLNERVNDFVDVFLLRELIADDDRASLRDACVEVFAVRDQHRWPPSFDPPDFWRDEFEEHGEALGLPVRSFGDAVEDLRGYISFIDAG